MPLSEDELVERDSRRDIGKELLEAVGQMKRGQTGFVHEVAIPAVASARTSAELVAIAVRRVARGFSPYAGLGARKAAARWRGQESDRDCRKPPRSPARIIGRASGGLDDARISSGDLRARGSSPKSVRCIYPSR